MQFTKSSHAIKLDATNKTYEYYPSRNGVIVICLRSKLKISL